MAYRDYLKSMFHNSLFGTCSVNRGVTSIWPRQGVLGYGILKEINFGGIIYMKNQKFIKIHNKICEISTKKHMFKC